VSSQSFRSGGVLRPRKAARTCALSRQAPHHRNRLRVSMGLSTALYAVHIIGRVRRESSPCHSRSEANPPIPPPPTPGFASGNKGGCLGCALNTIGGNRFRSVFTDFSAPVPLHCCRGSPV